LKLPRNITLLLWWIVLVAAGVGALIVPGLQSVRDLSQETDELRQRISANNDGAAALRRLEGRLEEARRVVREETTPIPEDSNVAALIRQLSSRLSDLGVTEREITTGSPAQLDDASSMPMSVRVKTEFLNIYEVIRWVESLPRLVRVERLSIERVSDDDDRTDAVEADIMLEAFSGSSEAVASAEGEPGAG